MERTLMSNVSIVVALFLIHCSLGVEHNKNRHNLNTDFLAHEAVGSLGGPKRDYVAPLNDNDYNSQFPSLGSPSTTTHTTPRSISVTHPVTPPLPPARKQQSIGLRDYVAPQLSTTKGPSTSNQNLAATQSPSSKQQMTGKRDYVSPQFTTRQPTAGTTGNVKNLINFYDQKSQNPNINNKTPNYSSIVQNNKNSDTASQAVNAPSPSTPTTRKPFSSIVSGSSTPGSSNSITNTTPKPPGYSTPVKPRPNNFTPISHPGNPVLPSSLTGNKNINVGTANNGLITDTELQAISEELLRKDTNNAAKYITVNYQQKTSSQSSEDKAPQPLLTIAPEVWNIPTIQKLVPLLDNYERDTSVNEHITAQERTEENAFMDAVMNTPVIRHLMTFLKEKGLVSPDPKQQRDFLKQMWFNMYSRGKGKISSSGFEHVFVSELKNGDVQGLHDWVYFSREESANRLNYLGYLKYDKLEDKGAVIKLHFNQQGIDKPVGTMFIGTSPELEIALYSLCFVSRADNDCKLKLGSKDVEIVTHTFRYRSKNYIGSAYPRI